MGRSKKVVENEETTKINKRGPYKKREKAMEVAIKTPTLMTVPKATKDLKGVRKNCLKIGDTQYKKYVDTGDVGHAAVALTGYKLAIDAAKTQLTYQKITGRGKKIDFCEE